MIRSIAWLVPMFAALYSASSHAEFAPRLLLEDVAARYGESGPFDPGHTEFKLLKDYWYIDSAGRKWTVPKGYVVNGASIPKAVWSVVGGPWSGKYRNAAVIHDYLTGEKISTSEIVHRLFYDSMRESGVSLVRARLMYAAVVVGGGVWSDVAGFTGAADPIELSEEQLEALELKIVTEDLSADTIRKLTIDDLD